MLATTNIPLLLIQCTCFCTTLVLAIVLLMARLHLRSFSRSYEISRGFLVGALLLYAVHYALQMLFGFRAQGEDVGALVNILFYLPIAFLLVCATLRISSRHSYLKRFMAVGLTGVFVNCAIFGVGLSVYGSLHMPWALRAMEVFYVAMIIFFIFKPGSELQRTYRKIEDETANDNSMYRLYMRSGTVLLYVMGFVGALSIFSTASVVAVAAFFLLALIFYVVCFVSFGFSIQGLSSVIEEGEKVHQPTPETPDASHLTAEQTEQIAAGIAAWRADHGYSSCNLTSITMAQRLGIPKRLLTQYLAEHEGVTFRVWLSGIRIEEAKRLLLARPDYSIEAVAEACGFSSRSWMQEKFKASTGMTPADWRDAKKK